MSTFDAATVEAAVELACRAPSIHNTQPWRWELGPDGLALRADRSRQLSVADRDGHSLMISCGAALTLAVLALRGAGVLTDVERLPDPHDPDLLARLTPAGTAEPDASVTAQLQAARQRHSDRRPFRAEPVPRKVLDQLRAATGAEGVYVDFPVQEEQQTALAVAVSWADRVERNDPEYIAEMTKWLRDPDVHAPGPDGIPAESVPHVTVGHPRHTDVPLRDFELGVSGRQLIEQDVDERPVIAVLFSESDTALEQLRSGEALMRLMLAAELHGLHTCPLSQAVDLVAFRARLQGVMGWIGLPQMMVRIGYPVPGERPPATPRRPLREVLHVLAG